MFIWMVISGLIVIFNVSDLLFHAIGTVYIALGSFFLIWVMRLLINERKLGKCSECGEKPNEPLIWYGKDFELCEKCYLLKFTKTNNGGKIN